jgi:hypothetical protein
MAAERSLGMSRGSRPSDGIDQQVWEILLDLCESAHTADVTAFRANLNRFNTESERGNLSVYYLLYLLESCVLGMLGRRPTEDDLRRLAESQDSRFRLLIGGQLPGADRLAILEGTLRRVFSYSFPDEVAGLEFFIYMAAAIGGILRRPRKDLERRRAGLARQIATHMPEIAV